jgi:hypothetical protein
MLTRGAIEQTTVARLAIKQTNRSNKQHSVERFNYQQMIAS